MKYHFRDGNIVIKMRCERILVPGKFI